MRHRGLYLLLNPFDLINALCIDEIGCSLKKNNLILTKSGKIEYKNMAKMFNKTIVNLLKGVRPCSNRSMAMKAA
jgi:hypothetical protein